MSDREFDNYLTLLASLLRLGRGQRERIAKELRAHLDDRLEELLAEGVSREEAIERALAEFGDAAGLAGEFASIARGRNRRWLMRVTTFSVAATILIAASLITFWPGRNAGPGVAQVAAQNAEQKQEQAKTEEKTNEATAKSRAVEEALNTRADFKFVEIPLRDVMKQLGKQIDIQFVLDVRRLEEAGVSADSPVTRELKGVRARTFLDFVLSDFELAYFERDDEKVVVITTPERVETMMHIRVYDCRDLLSMSSPQNDYEKRVRALVQAVEMSVVPATWKPAGGPASLSEFSGLLVIVQNREGHRQVEGFLDMLREAASIEKTADDGVR